VISWAATDGHFYALTFQGWAKGWQLQVSIAEAKHLCGQITLEQRRRRDAARLLLDTARRLEPLDTAVTRKTCLQAPERATFREEFTCRCRP